MMSRNSNFVFKRLMQIRSMSAKACVLIEHNNNNVINSSLNAITAMKAITQEITCVVFGTNVSKVVEQLEKVDGVKKIITSESESFKGFLSEDVANALKKCQDEQKFTHIAGTASAFSNNVLPRLGALLDVAPISSISSVISEDTFVRPIYAGNIMATVKSRDPVKILTVRGTAFQPPAEGATNSVEKSIFEADAKSQLSEFVSQELTKSERPELQTARIVVSGGRGLKSAENFKIIYDLADKLKAGVGASRAAVDAGYVANDMQVGQTGKVVAPELYIAIGISGAIQHLAGMKDSKTIVAINQDADAPIFQVSDYGLVADLFKVVPELTSKV